MFGHKLYWILPLFSAMMWLATLLGLLITWLVDGSPHYASFDPHQTIAYISDVGAQRLKPLFITGSCITVVGLDLGLIAERWLRHRGRLAPNTSWWQKGSSIIAIIAAIAGAAGLILLSIFDTLRHPKLHDKFLGLFIIGYVVSAIFVCIEYGRLRAHHKQTVIRVSFWMKIFFIVVEVALAIAFGVLNTTHKHINVAAVLEWVIALIFTGYVLSFMVDLLPAATSKHHYSKETVAEAGNSPAYVMSNGTNGYANPASNY